MKEQKMNLHEAMMAQIDYIELLGQKLAATKAFYEATFGWSFTDFGPQYSATEGLAVDVGLDASDEAVKAPLPVIRVSNLERAAAAVKAAGGVISVPIFGFPGGRRFHFKDPSGNELAVWCTP
jgi:predicted enzyme related to lactoylglutathione lyase